MGIEPDRPSPSTRRLSYMAGTVVTAVLAWLGVEFWNGVNVWSPAPNIDESAPRGSLAKRSSATSTQGLDSFRCSGERLF